LCAFHISPIHAPCSSRSLWCVMFDVQIMKLVIIFFSCSRIKLKKFASAPCSQISAVSDLSLTGFQKYENINYLTDSNIDRSIDLS
jgi:hypothetical protein